MRVQGSWNRDDDVSAQRPESDAKDQGDAGDPGRSLRGYGHRLWISSDSVCERNAAEGGTGADTPALFLNLPFHFSNFVLFIHSHIKRIIQIPHANMHPIPGFTRSMAAPHRNGTAIIVMIFP